MLGVRLGVGGTMTLPRSPGKAVLAPKSSRLPLRGCLSLIPQGVIV